TTISGSSSTTTWPWTWAGSTPRRWGRSTWTPRRGRWGSARAASTPWISSTPSGTPTPRTSRCRPTSSSPTAGPSSSSAAQGEVERRASALGALGPDAAAVAVDDPLHGGQADAGALELGGGVQALEGGEQLLGVDHVEAGPVVADEEHPLALVALALLPHLAAGGRLLAGELPG